MTRPFDPSRNQVIGLGAAALLAGPLGACLGLLLVFRPFGRGRGSSSTSVRILWATTVGVGALCACGVGLLWWWGARSQDGGPPPGAFLEGAVLGLAPSLLIGAVVGAMVAAVVALLRRRPRRHSTGRDAA